MRRKWLLIAAGVSVLCLVGMLPVLAQGPGNNPIFATIEYVDQKVAELYAYVDEKIAEVGGGGGPDFDLPDQGDWTGEAYTRVEGEHTEGVLTLYQSDPEKTCSWNGAPIHGPTALVETRAVARYDGAPLGYAYGYCGYIYFEGLSGLPPVGETVKVDVWFFWMGKEKKTTVPITVTSMPPVCSLSADPEYGFAPLDVTFTATTSDPDGDEIVEYRWTFTDGTVIEEGSPVEVHTFTNPDWYYADLYVTDATGAVGICESIVQVD